MNSVHTPGPWLHAAGSHPQNAATHVVKEHEPWVEIAVLYCSPSGPDAPGADEVWGDDPERDANARLIAAAPDLLEVAEKLVEAIEWDRHEARTVGEIEAAWKAVEAAARTAIAKAVQS